MFKAGGDRQSCLVASRTRTYKVAVGRHVECGNRAYGRLYEFVSSSFSTLPCKYGRVLKAIEAVIVSSDMFCSEGGNVAAQVEKAWSTPDF